MLFLSSERERKQERKRARKRKSEKERKRESEKERETKREIENILCPVLKEKENKIYFMALRF